MIFNYKCPPSTAAQKAARARYKEAAVADIAAGLRSAIARPSAEQITWLPIPPSKAQGHADYDDRLTRTLRMAFAGYNADIRQLLRQTASTEADHAAGNRLDPEELYGLLQVDQTAIAARPIQGTIALFDDVLTTGKHFKCCERPLREVLPADVTIIGVFVARRILSAPTAAEEFPMVPQL